MVGSNDDFDYVDRRVALVSVTRVLGSINRGFVMAQLGDGDDRAERARLTHGIILGGTFRPNRGVTEGDYTLGVIDAELNPDVTGESMDPGIGAATHYEIGRGDLAWQRAQVSLFGRKYWGPIALSVDAEGGAVAHRCSVWSSPTPHQARPQPAPDSKQEMWC